MSKEKVRGFELVSYAKKKNEELISDGKEPLFKIPIRGTTNAAAYDFFSPVSFIIKPNEKFAVKSGIKTYFLPDEGFFILTRSGNGAKRRITLANNVGLVDADYYNNDSNEGEIIIVLVNNGDKDFSVEIGDRIAQGWFQKVLFADNDETFGSRKGGLGSTGMK